MGTEGPGYVFVVNGAMADLAYDAAIISTSHEFGVGHHWASTLGAEWARLAKEPFRARVRSELKPDGWATRGFGRRPERERSTDRPTWFIDVASDSPINPSIADVFERLVSGLAEIADAIDAGSGRERPLVALPVLGVGRGGWAAIAGDVINRQLRACWQVAQARGIDVVIVAASASDFSAFQARRRAPVKSREIGLGISGHVDVRARRVAERATDQSLALFLGAGVSIAAGLPSWDKLLAALEAKAEMPESAYFGERLTELDRAELVQAVLKRDVYGETIRSEVSGTQYAFAARVAGVAALPRGGHDELRRPLREGGELRHG